MVFYHSKSLHHLPIYHLVLNIGIRTLESLADVATVTNVVDIVTVAGSVMVDASATVVAIRGVTTVTEFAEIPEYSLDRLPDHMIRI